MNLYEKIASRMVELIYLGTFLPMSCYFKETKVCNYTLDNFFKTVELIWILFILIIIKKVLDIFAK